MEDPDDLDNIFDEYESTSRHGDEENVNNNADSVPNEPKSPERVPVPTRRIVKNPRLKFNPDRLCGERGIPTLVKHFKDVKFKGKGHEKEDLNKLMSSLTHWCHRLFPSMKFEDCLRQIEKLGKKRPVQTCLRKIRLDMPILNSDFVDEEVEREEDQREPDVEPIPEDAFDRLLNDNIETTVSNVASNPSRDESTGNVLGTSFGSTLTDEQRRRMEYNRLLAAERRKAKLAAMESANSESINNDCDQGASLSESQVAYLDSSQCEETGNSVNKSPVCSLNTQSETVINCEDMNELVVTKDSEELGIDELMDLVEDEDQSIETEKNIDSVKNVLASNDQMNSYEVDEESTHNSISKSPIQCFDSKVIDSECFAGNNEEKEKTEDQVESSED